MTETIKQTLRESKAARWFALGLVAFTMLSAYFFVDMMAPLQLLLEKKYGWQPDTYGFFSGSEYMLNVFGFLIISGIILDKMGIRFTGLTAACTMLIGGLIKYYGLTDYFNNGGFGYDFFNSFWLSMPASAKVASIGYAIFGIGVEMAGITISKTIVKWFKGKELALAMGMEMATARLGASVAFFFSSAIAGAGKPGEDPIKSIWFGLGLLSIGLLTFLTYIFMDLKLDKQESEHKSEEPAEEFRLSDLGKILTNRGFLLISLLCVLFYCGVFPFLKYAVNMMQNRLGISNLAAGYISGLLPVGTIILTPIIGSFLDRKGKGATMMIWGAALLTIAHLTFALAPMSMALAIIAIMVLGVAFSLVPASMWPSVPKIVEDRYLGSAYALVFWIQNIGLWFIPWLIGVVLVKVNPGVAERIQAGDTSVTYNYTVPMLIFSALGVAAIFLGFMLKREDKRKGYGLELPNKRS
ncbi:MAG: major facilitator superfamily domain-containing protein 1 [Bacteroidales bacterium]|nr:major facilitator superfamily domain-containing protein 1 [Bacteroidales bacterium]